MKSVQKNATRALALAASLGIALVAPPAFADEMDDLFSDPGAAEVTEAKTVENPESLMFAANPFTWAGDFNMSAGAGLGYEKAPADIKDWDKPSDNLMFSLRGRLWFDARPSNSFRVFGKFAAAYPFSTNVLTSASATTSGTTTTLATSSTSINTIQVFELFSDFDWNDTVFFRVGKQNAGWGVSRFYQVADPLSVGVKDPTNLDQDLEGPVAFKATLPFGLNSITAIGAVKDSYIKDGVANASIKDVGIGAKTDLFVKVPDNKVLGNGQLSLGAYYQRNLSPKFVASYSTGIGKFQVFTDQVVQLGLDSYRLTGDTETVSAGPGVSLSANGTEKPGKDKPFYSATAGTMYTNSDWHFTLYAEYLFNGAGSSSKTYYKDFAARYGYESAKVFAQTLSATDMFGYLGMHNSGVNIGWSELFGNDHFAFSTTWLQNWNDLSGVVKPALTIKPFKHFSLEIGTSVAWGDDQTEWVIKTSKISATEIKPLRTQGYIAFKLTDGKF
jgi:hypothetical protein